MRNIAPEEIAAVIMLAVAGVAMLVGGIIMLQPAHSEQARPRLAHLTVPGIPPELDRANRDETANYRDLNNPARKQCVDSTPHSKEKPRDLYVTVTEGDRRRMRQLIAYSAKVHGSPGTPDIRRLEDFFP